jgi:hypothetical protein
LIFPIVLLPCENQGVTPDIEETNSHGQRARPAAPAMVQVAATEQVAMAACGRVVASGE